MKESTMRLYNAIRPLIRVSGLTAFNMEDTFMKKFMILFVAGVLGAAFLAGCGKGDDAAAAPKADAPAADAPKTDAPKADAPKADAPKTDAPAGAPTTGAPADKK